jgi:crossover junction endodeoxyribonuclease RuvC
MRVLGVDPGKTGALALWDTCFGELTVEDMPTLMAKGRPRIADAVLAEMFATLQPDIAYVELVHAMPKQGVASSFDFGVSFGVLRGVIAARNIPVVFVTPNEWKRHYRLGADKGDANLRATQLFPRFAKLFSFKTKHGRAEAALLALFGART